MNSAIINNSNKKFLYAGIAIALLISIAAPFLASSDPDGLESAAGNVIHEDKLKSLEEHGPVFNSPMVDYSIEGMGKLGEVIAIIFGTLLIVVISYAVGKGLKK